jgi:hypothetical protein
MGYANTDSRNQPPARDGFLGERAGRAENEDKTMTTTPVIDDSRIETRFVWARCAAKNARAMRDLIRAFQSDGWATPRNVVAGKRVIRSRRSRK